MIIEDAIKNKIIEKKGSNSALLRNILKEELQNFVLNYIYNSKYKTLIFTGGTCLRKNYGLNRLSEDLDFDYVEDFNIDEFAKDINNYFLKTLKYKSLSTKISTNRKSLFLKFPILKDLGMLNQKGTPEDLFLRCDFSKDEVDKYAIENNTIKVGNYECIVTSYDLPTLFANKIVAVLEINFFKGKYQKIPSKGRDIYDLYWFLQISSNTGFKLKPNIERLSALMKTGDIKMIKESLIDKINLIEEEYLYNDLFPLIETQSLLDSFKKSFKADIIKKLDYVL